jgi:hypothetical protein
MPETSIFLESRNGRHQQKGNSMTDINAPLPELDAKAIATLIVGLGLVVAGIGVTLQVPQARDLFERVLSHPEVQKAGRNAVAAVVRSVAGSLGWSIEKVSGSLVD